MILENKNLYFVGGIVRDKLLGIKNIDTDFCYEGNAIEFAKNQNLNIIKINSDFGTVKVCIENSDIDIASTRRETYPHKGHLPKVTDIGCSLKDDLIRRDFTINAMAERTTDGELIDYFEGIKDIKSKELRILHKNSFIDDPTRIIRGLKFSVRFDFRLNNETKELQDKYLDNINYDMSYYRVRKELIETFNINKAEVFDKFIEEKIYRLLGENIKIPSLKGKDIESAIRNIRSEHVWFIYIATILCINKNTELHPFLTRKENRILEWVERLKKEKAGNNTPKESIVIRELLYNV